MKPNAWRRGPIQAALVLWIGAFALLAACNEGDKKMPPFGSKSSASWNELTVPGMELFLEAEKTSPYRSWGAARVDGSRSYLRGKEAFDAARTRVGNNPTALATLSMLFLEEGVAGKKPWTQPTGGAMGPDQEAIAKPPTLSGGNLIYWRPHAQLADLVRCRVSLSSGDVACELGGDVLFAERVAKDPAGAAKKYLASDNLYTRTRGIEALGHVGDDHAREQLIDIALNAYEREERRVAVTVLGKTGGAGVVAALSRVLLYDRFDEVREAAATALGDLRDPAARDALQRAESGDADIRVRVLSTDALKKLK